MTGVPLTSTVPSPRPDGGFDDGLILVVDSVDTVRRCPQVVGRVPVAAIVAWRLPAELARPLYRLGVPVFCGVPEAGFGALTAGAGWDEAAEVAEVDRMAAAEVAFARAVPAGR